MPWLSLHRVECAADPTHPLLRTYRDHRSPKRYHSYLRKYSSNYLANIFYIPVPIFQPLFFRHQLGVAFQCAQSEQVQLNKPVPTIND